MSKATENIIGLLLLANIAYLIWGNYDGVLPYIPLVMLIGIIGYYDKKQSHQIVTKKEKRKNKDQIIESYSDFKKKILFYRKVYGEEIPIKKIYIDEKEMDSIKKDFKVGYIKDRTFDEIIDDYLPLDIDMIDFEDFIKTKYFKENSIYKTRSKLLKADKHDAENEIKLLYAKKLQDLAGSIDSKTIKEHILNEGKSKIEEIDMDSIY